MANLEIAQLGELFPAIVQLAGIWLGLFVRDLVGSDIAALGESLVADLARIGLFASVSALMGLKHD